MSDSEPFVIHENECDPEGWNETGPGHFRWRTLISGDRTPTDSLTLGVAEIDAGVSQDLPLHQHEQVEVYYILDGEGIVTISGSEFHIRPGSAVFVPGRTRHGARNTGTGPLRILYVFQADSFARVEYDFETVL